MSEKRKTYKRRHARLHHHRGSAASLSPCLYCGNPKSEWAQVHGTSGDDVYDYFTLCRSCHRIYDGKVKAPVVHSGTRSVYAYKLSWKSVEVIRERAEFERHADLAREFGISRSHVSNIYNGNVRVRS